MIVPSKSSTIVVGGGCGFVVTVLARSRCTCVPPAELCSQRGGGHGYLRGARSDTSDWAGRADGVRSTPMPSISSSTTSPGRSQRPSPCSRMHPLPTVPEPSTSPGTAACSAPRARRWPATSGACRASCRVNAPRRSRARPSPDPTRRARRRSTSTGPRLVAKSLPLTARAQQPSRVAAGHARTSRS